MLSEAGLELAKLTLSSLCLTELIARGEARQSLDTAGASLVVLRDGARAHGLPEHYICFLEDVEDAQ